MHLCLGNRVDIGRVIVYYARAAHSFSAEIKCRHCMNRPIIISLENSLILTPLAFNPHYCHLVRHDAYSTDI